MRIDVYADAGHVPRIDVHHHIIPPFYRAALQARGLFSPIRGIQFPAWDVESTLEMMDRQGIATAITSIVEPGVYFGDVAAACDLARQCNEFSALLVASHAGRFGALAVLPLPDLEATLHELEYALDTLCLDGITLLTNYRGTYLGDAAFDPLFAELNRRQTPVFIHPSTPAGINLPTFDYPVGLYELTFDTTRTVAHLLYSGALTRFPDLRLILPHAGGAVPFLAGRLTFAASVVPQIKERAPADIIGALRRLYFDTAMSATPHALPSLQALADPSHILFGSDWPFVAAPVVAATVAGLAQHDGFDAEARCLIEFENALRLCPRLRQVIPAGSTSTAIEGAAIEA
jgi:predicted TIM-barrel fold metal-dependent hydrolase